MVGGRRAHAGTGSVRVDGRVKPGHDGGEVAGPGHSGTPAVRPIAYPFPKPSSPAMTEEVGEYIRPGHDGGEVAGPSHGGALTESRGLPSAITSCPGLSRASTDGGSAAMPSPVRRHRPEPPRPMRCSRGWPGQARPRRARCANTSDPAMTRSPASSGSTMPPAPRRGALDAISGHPDTRGAESSNSSVWAFKSDYAPRWFSLGETD